MSSGTTIRNDNTTQPPLDTARPQYRYTKEDQHRLSDHRNFVRVRVGVGTEVSEEPRSKSWLDK